MIGTPVHRLIRRIIFDLEINLKTISIQDIHFLRSIVTDLL